MKAIRYLLIGIILGAVIGWFLGYLHLPYIEKIPPFLLGFITCVLLFALAFALLFAWKKNSSLLRMMAERPLPQDSKNAIRTYGILWIMVVAFIIAGGLFSGFLIHRQSKLFNAQLKEQNKKIQDQAELNESTRKSNMIFLVNNILDKVDDDLKNNPAGKLSDKTIANIVEAFNYSFMPYRYWESDSLSEKKLSPEKGQLLLELCAKNIDSSSFDKIKHGADFSGADLNKGNLNGVNLSDADLEDADLSYCDLNGASLKGADLRNANLRGAYVNNVNLVGADLRRTILSWAELNGAQFDSANLNGADLTNAQLRNADLRKATFRAGKLDGALLNEANMQDVLLIDASLKKANLTRADLTRADVNRANFSEAIMTGTELTKILNVDKDWFEKLNEWQVTGAKEIQENYQVVLDKVIDNVPRYRLDKK